MAADVAALYELHWNAIYRFLSGRMIGASADDIEDVTATVFERVCKYSDRYSPQPGCTASSWLYQIARNTAADHYRAKAVRPVTEAFSVETPEGPAVVDAGTDQQVDALVLADALMKLSPRHRLLVIERYLMGASHAETALVLGSTVEGSKKMQTRALAQLRKLLAA